MYSYVWEYVVAPGGEAAFEEAYGARGDWARLFERAPGYLGTELLRDVGERRRYLTIDRWASRAACLAHRERVRAEFDAIDAACARLTESERAIGEFDLVGP